MAKRLSFQICVLTLAVLGTSCRQSANTNSVSGTIETDEVHVASRYGGRVDRILAWEGDSLTNGQVLVELEAGELNAQRDQAAAQLAEAKAGPRAQEITAAKSDWESLVAELEFARANEKRTLELFAQKTISATERDLAVSKAAALAKNVAAAKSRYDLLQAGTRPEQIAQARAKLAEIDTRLREMTILAPTNCVLEVLSVKVGDVLPPNREVATLLMTQHLWVRVYVPETWLGRIKIGDEASVRVDSFPGKEFRGVIEQVQRAAEFTPRNVQTVEERVKQVFGIKLRLENSEGKLQAGMAADVDFPNLRK